MTSRPIAIDLFCGAGGLSLGLEQAGFDVVLAIDRDPYHVATHRRNFPQGPTICASIQDVSGGDVRNAIGPDCDIDLICGGPPCQGFSHMGKRDAADPRNALVDDFVRLVIDLKPKAFLLENVPGMRIGDGAAVISRAASRLTQGGYIITEPVRTLDAADFGVPQRRERLFILGVRNEFGRAIQYPEGPCDRRPRPTVWEAIGDLPSLVGRDDLLLHDATLYRSIPHDQLHPYVQAARGVRPDAFDLSRRREWNHEECSGCSRVRHSREVERLYAATEPGRSVPAHNLPRLHPDGIAPTLRAGTDSEHGSYNAPRPVHPYEPRCITVREAARLHGYPDWFGFYPRKWHAHRQIGNSVCPPVAHALAASVLRTLGIHPSRCPEHLVLAEEFIVPTAHKHHPRVSQIDEWPKVLQALLSTAGRKRAGALRRPDFSVADVARAFESSGARMPRTRPERFLADIARSRNTSSILSPVTAAGFSILPVGDNGTYGRFVPLGTPGTVDDKPFLAISRAELAQAIRVQCDADATVQPNSLLSLVLRRDITRALFDVGSIHLCASAAAHTGRTRTLFRFDLCHKKRRLRSGVLVIAHRGELPSLPSVRTILSRYGVGTAILVVGLTLRHFAALVVRRRGDVVAPSRRRTFELVGDRTHPKTDGAPDHCRTAATAVQEAE